MQESDDAKFRRVIERAWKDSSFHKSLVDDPTATLKQEGIEPPPGAMVTVLQSTQTQRYFVIPPPPDHTLSAAEVLEKSSRSDYRALVHVLYNVNCC